MKKILVTGLAVLALNGSAWAFDGWVPERLDAVNIGSYFVGIGTGPFFPDVSSHSYASSVFGLPDDRYSTNHEDTGGLIDLAVGYTWTRCSNWIPYYSLGLSYTYGFPFTVSGKVDQFSIPGAENYNYDYKIQTQTFLAFMKADIYRWHNIMPFLTLGLGASLNDASNYSEAPVSGVIFPRPDPAFRGHTDDYFSYMVGAGIDYPVLNNLMLSLEYKYTDLGNAQTGQGLDTHTNVNYNFVNSQLKNRVTTNALLFTATYYLIGLY